MPGTYVFVWHCVRVCVCVCVRACVCTSVCVCVSMCQTLVSLISLVIDGSASTKLISARGLVSMIKKKSHRSFIWGAGGN